MTQRIILEDQRLLNIARWAKRRGEKLATIVKLAVDANTLAYWSEYYMQYGDQLTRDLAPKFQRVAQEGYVKEEYKGLPIEVWQQGDSIFEYKIKDARGKAIGGGSGSTQDEAISKARVQIDSDDLTKQAMMKNGQYVYNVAVQAKIASWVTLLPDALEHSMKFAIEAMKIQGVAHISVDHCFSDVVAHGEGPGAAMTGYANCAVAFAEDKAPASFAAQFESQLKDYLQKADFPAEAISVASPQKRASVEDVMKEARAGSSLARMSGLFGLHQAQIAQRCAAREAAGVSFTPDALFLAKIAQVQLEEFLDWEGEATNPEGSLATTKDGFEINIKYDGTQKKPFHWLMTDPGGNVLDQGDSETFQEAEGDAKKELPKNRSDLEKSEQETKMAFVAKFGLLASIKCLAKVGAVEEFKLETKAGKTLWATRIAGQIADSAEI